MDSPENEALKRLSNDTDSRNEWFQIGLRDMWGLVLEHRRVVFGFCAVVLSVTIVSTAMATRLYRSKVVLEVQPQLAQELRVQGLVETHVPGNIFVMEQFYRTEAKKIASRTAREEVIRRYQELGFDDLPEGRVGLGRLMGMMSVAPQPSSRLIDILVLHEDPEKAALLANLIAEVYLNRSVAARQQQAAMAREWLESQMLEYERQIAEESAGLIAFRAQADLADAKESVSTMVASLQELNEVNADLEREKLLLETGLRRLEELQDAGEYGTLSKIAESDTLKTLIDGYTRMKLSHAEVESRYAEKHPKFLESKGALDGISREIERELGRVLESERVRFELVRSKERSVSARIDEMKSRLLDHQKLLAEHDAMQDRLAHSRKFYETLSSRYDELTLAARTQLNNATIVDRAWPSVSSVYPRWSLNLLLGIVLGVVGGAGLAVFRGVMDDTLASGIDVSVHLDVPFLGVVPAGKSGMDRPEAALYTYRNPKSIAAEAVRGIRTTLEMHHSAWEVDVGEVLAVTSALIAEGKTILTVRLGVAFASLDQKVLLIDADLRRSRLHQVFDLPEGKGLCEVLRDGEDPMTWIRDTEVPNLKVLHARGACENPHELLASDRMKEVIAQCRHSFDLVLIDTPPIVAVSDALVLSRVVDGMVIVARAKTHSRDVVRHAVERLRQVDANILGLVLNAMELNAGGRYGYRYAGSYYYREPYYRDDEGDSEGTA